MKHVNQALSEGKNGFKNYNLITIYVQLYFQSARTTKNNQQVGSSPVEQLPALGAPRPLGSEDLSSRSHPAPAGAEGRAERSQGPMSASRGQEERPRFSFVAGRPQLSGQLLRVPAPLLGAGQEVLNDTWVEGGGDTLHQQLGLQDQGEEFLVTV